MTLNVPPADLAGSAAMIAYESSDLPIERPVLEPASRWRDWMEVTHQRWPNRCLPLLVANESGWVVRLPHSVCARWDGGVGDQALEIEPAGLLATSQFGMGILTFEVPFLFRTPPGWDMLARGPANSPRDAVSPLEGLVEADWGVAPFTMNWQITRAGVDVHFAEGDVYCQLVPQRRWDLESLEPVIVPFSSDETLAAEVQSHMKDRGAAKRLKAASRLLGHDDRSWDGRYFRGLTASGAQAAEHRTTRRLRPFRR